MELLYNFELFTLLQVLLLIGGRHVCDEIVFAIPLQLSYFFKPCPILLDWTEWSTCSKTCDGGVRTRNRVCIGQCNVPLVAEELCNVEVCS